MSHNVLVIGGAGYIGSECARKAHDDGHVVLVLDDLSTGNRESLSGYPINLIERDIADISANGLSKIIKAFGIDCIFHLAAKASVPESINDPNSYYQVNLVGTKTILDAMVASNCKNIIFSSSAAVYGPTYGRPCVDDVPKPIVPYGSSKYAAEMLIKDYAVAYGIKYAIFRYFNAAGASIDGKYGECRKRETHIIPLIIKAMLNMDVFKIYGDDFDTPDGTCIRDYVHISDIADEHIKNITPTNVVMNVGSGVGYSVRDIIELCESIAGLKVKTEICERRPGDPPMLVSSVSHGKRIDITNIIKSALKWHMEHLSGY